MKEKNKRSKTEKSEANVFTKGNLLKLVERVARDCHSQMLDSMVQNRHMNELTEKDIRKIRRHPKYYQRLVDAILVNFVNTAGADQGLDWGFYVKHLKKSQPKTD